MPKRCSICIHKKRKEIESAILGGTPLSLIEKRFAVSQWAVWRHKNKGHVLASLVKAQEIKEVAMAGTLLEQPKSLQEKALELLYMAEAAGDYRTALAGVREARGSLEVLVDAMSKLRENSPIQQQFISFDQAQIGEVVRALLDTGVLALPEADKRGEAVIIEDGDRDSTMGDRCW